MKRAILLATFWVVCATGSLANAVDLSGQKARAISLIQAYEEALAPEHDPFAFVYSLEQGVLVFERLMYRKVPGANTMERSPLGYLNDALIQFRARRQELDPKLLDLVLSDAQNVLESSGYPKEERQANWLALQDLLEYMRRFDPVTEVVDRDGEPAEEKKEGKQEPKQEQKKQDKPPKPKKFPDTPENYRPHSKDTDNKEPGSKDDQFVAVEVNFETPFWGQRLFGDVDRYAALPFRELSLPQDLPAPGIGSSNRYMKVYPHGSKQMRLFLPPGYQPLQPVDPRAQISRTPSGGYQLNLNEDLNEVKIPLKPASPEVLMPNILQKYTAKVGIDDYEWPDLIRVDLFDRYSPAKKHADRLALAQAVADHISGKYLYSVGARPEADPIDALKAGAFQCDMAAYIMVGVLRDAYGIEARAVGGMRAKKRGSGSNKKSFLVMPGEGHAWVEVYHNGLWHTFDPTPIKKDRKDKKDEKNEEGDKDEYSDRKLENTLEPEPEEQDDDKKTDTDNPAEQVKQDTQKRLDEDKANAGNETKSAAGEAGDGLDKMDTDDLVAMLELGSLELEPKLDENPLRQRGLRVLLRRILHPKNTGYQIALWLKQVEHHFTGAEVLPLMQEAARIHQKNHQPLARWLDEVNASILRSDLAESYLELYRITKSTEHFVSLLDSEAVAYPTALIAKLKSVMRDIMLLAHGDSAQIAMVDAFYRSLPGILQQLMRERYNLDEVGPNPPTRKIAEDLMSNELNKYKLVASLEDVSDLILNSTPRPEMVEVKTWERDVMYPYGQDYMALERFSDITRGILLQPGKSLEENMQEESIVVASTRETMLIPLGYGEDETERITVVLYDTSGSMQGESEIFQAGLIAAFTARAIGDVSPSGRHRHKVLLLPFDDKVGIATPVTNVQEALKVVNNFDLTLGNTGGGTDIQGALMQAFALIADAERRSGEPLAAANIVLMTDGQATIDVAKLGEAREAIDRSTPLQTLFVAIRDTNPELLRFASESEKMGVERGFYREFSRKSISDYLALSNTPSVPLHGTGRVYTDHRPASLKASTLFALDEAGRLMHDFVADAAQLLAYVKPQQHWQNFERTPWSNRVTEERDIAKWLEGMRRFGNAEVFKTVHEFLELVVHDIYTRLEKLVRVPFAGFSQIEQEQVRHLLKEASK